MGSRIDRIASKSIEAPPDAAAIDADGLMPGLTDVRWHPMFAPNRLEHPEMANPGLTHANAVAEAGLR